MKINYNIFFKENFFLAVCEDAINEYFVLDAMKQWKLLH